MGSQWGAGMGLSLIVMSQGKEKSDILTAFWDAEGGYYSGNMQKP